MRNKIADILRQNIRIEDDSEEWEGPYPRIVGIDAATVALIALHQPAETAGDVSDAVNLAEQWKDRADDCGRLARAILAHQPAWHVSRDQLIAAAMNAMQELIGPWRFCDPKPAIAELEAAINYPERGIEFRIEKNGSVMKRTKVTTSTADVAKKIVDAIIAAFPGIQGSERERKLVEAAKNITDCLDDEEGEWPELDLIRKALAAYPPPGEAT